MKNIWFGTRLQCLTWRDLCWKKSYLVPQGHADSLKEKLRQKRETAGKIGRLIRENREEHYLQIRNDSGKVTDCGYDILSCVTAEVPAVCDFRLSAELTVVRFLREPGPTNQEAFGIIVRDTLKQNPETGLCYSNMAGVGGYYGRYNFFGRTGISAGDFGHVVNFALYPPAGTDGRDPLRYRITPEAPKRFRMEFVRRGTAAAVSMRDEQGTDVLSAAFSGGNSVSDLNSGILSADGEYSIDLSDAFESIRKGSLYLGFFAAGGTEIRVHTDTVRLEIRRSGRRGKKTAPGVGPVFDPLEDPSCPPAEDWERAALPGSGKIWYAAPGGAPDGAGTADDPLDIRSAVERCGNGETVFLRGGRYCLDHDLVIARQHSGTLTARKKITGGSGPDGKVLLDFMGARHSFRVSGDFWDVEKISVSNGFGIKIEGNYNHIKNCRAFRNLETGILIRHPANTSPRREWPHHNLVEDCVSFENRDLSECGADGFACKVASGAGNCFRNCVSWLNSDDGFDLFAKNRRTGAVMLENCSSFLNGYKTGADGGLLETAGNGSGFKLGGSGMYTEHHARNCLAEGNKGHGFTSNSNPFLWLANCTGRSNGQENIKYFYYDGIRTGHLCRLQGCEREDPEHFDPYELLERIRRIYTEGIPDNDRAAAGLSEGSKTEQK